MRRAVETRKYVAFVTGAYLLWGAATVHAYDPDTHYVFTYYLARKVGFTPGQARQIASANASIDSDPNTEPLQLERTANPTGDPQTLRARFHALPESRDALTSRVPNDILAVREIHDRLEQLWGQAVATGNPGIYLHYLQDTFSHKGYWSAIGHAVAGHSQDYLDRDHAEADKMTFATLEKLQQFMKRYMGQEPCDPSASEIRTVLNQLFAANPVPHRKPVNREFGTPRLPPPDWKKAQKIVAAVLNEDVPDWIQYHFDQSGNPKLTDRGELTTKMDPNWALRKANALEYIVGRWRDVNGQFVRVIYTPKAGEGDDYHVELNGKHEWTGVYTAEGPHKGEWIFTRKPEAAEMSDKAPEWVRKSVAGTLQWRLVLRVDGCNLKLKGRWYPGLVAWKEVRDAMTHEILEKESKAEVPAGEEGWGQPKDVEYVWVGRY